MATETKAHQLYKQVPGTTVIATVDGGSLPLTGVSATNGWYAQNIAAALGWATYTLREYIDLSGWSEQDLTTFTQGVDVQKSQLPGLASNILEIVEFDLLTTRRLTDDECGIQFLNPMTTPGFLGSTLDLMELIYGEQRTYVENQQIDGTFITTNTETYGSGNPTAMDKLHWTRIYLVKYVTGSTVTTQPTNLVVQAITSKEKDLVWMERLRRSYELQGGAD
jgi:hypothetical protein